MGRVRGANVKIEKVLDKAMSGVSVSGTVKQNNDRNELKANIVGKIEVALECLIMQVVLWLGT